MQNTDIPAEEWPDKWVELANNKQAWHLVAPLSTPYFVNCKTEAEINGSRDLDR